MWRLDSSQSPEPPATPPPAEPCHNSEGVFQVVQDGAVEVMHAAPTMDSSPPPPAWQQPMMDLSPPPSAWQPMEAMVAWQQFQPLLQCSMAPWPAAAAQGHGSCLFGGAMMGWEEQALPMTPYASLPYNALPVLATC